ncbi:hypothetical protein AAFC00_002746 [Neodothiora populina]|uniref:ubiquitinyl hydrolase 1 n=1 Tax=Neodothiora populina TaxID=2781224 RepID=A0ABR3P829_9PEZI
MSASQMSEFITYDRRSLVDYLFGSSRGAWAATGIALFYLLYNIVLYFDVLPLLSFSEVIWNAIVLLTPTSLALSMDRWRNPDLYTTTPSEIKSRSEMFAVKSEALRRVFGLEAGALKILPGASSIRRASWLGGITSTRSDAPPGLGNWDNSCYQNSVLQGLSAIRSLTTYLEDSDVIKQQDTSTTAGSLREIMSKLNDSENNGRRIWTPAKLKSMSSWQQQDAQEYFSKIMDDLEKETAKATTGNPVSDGIELIKEMATGISAKGQRLGQKADSPAAKPRPTPQTPLDGHLAQRVACLKCGFSEGLSMIPFNCLTVPLGNRQSYDISQCLDSYTSLEEISGVECAKCTLLQQKTQLKNMTKSTSEDATSPATENELPAAPTTMPPELRKLCLARLRAVQEALDESDFSDATLNKKCQVPKKARVSSTKTKQMVVARAPTGLIVHVNRSMFDEYTGDMRKNLAHVNYPKVLDLGPWCIGVPSKEDADKEEWCMDPAKSMISGRGRETKMNRVEYILRAAVCHYGRHENGHYICYREHPELQDKDTGESAKMRWWRLSDDDVSPVTEEQVLAQGGAFMLFYERLENLGVLQTSKAEVMTQEKSSSTNVGRDEAVAVPASDSVCQPLETINAPEQASAAPPLLAEDAPSLEPQRMTAPHNPALVQDEHITASSESAPALPTINHTSHSPPLEFKKPSPPPMRTAGRGSKLNKANLGSSFRPIAA